jgi:hypothetical protein
MKLFVLSTLLAVAAAFTTQPISGPARVADSAAHRTRKATIVHDGKANGTLRHIARGHAYVCDEPSKITPYDCWERQREDANFDPSGDPLGAILHPM